MQCKIDGRMHMLGYFTIFSLHELYKNNCKAVNFPGASIEF